uniref:C-type lectin domain-containing protein n=1 Tax=Echeneis naucrates TaxID=173247 RepID=A0A665X9D3_ECHNA
VFLVLLCLILMAAVTVVLILYNSSCPGNWVKFDNSCYLLSASKKNNKESMKSCESLDAHLVVVEVHADFRKAGEWHIQ